MPPADPPAPSGDQGKRFLLLYALAYAGGFIAYVPLLTILLPVKMAAVAGEARIEWLAAATLLGAIAASVANVGFGYASDLTRSRKPWIAVGLVLTILLYAALHAADSGAGIVAIITLWQVALNMLLSPLAAYAADHVPDHQKGRLGGLLGAGPPMGSLAAVIVTLPLFADEAARFAATCALIVLTVGPLLLFGRPHAVEAGREPFTATERRLRRGDLALMWCARLLVQIAGSVLFSFLLYYFQSLPGALVGPETVARVAGLTLVAAIPIALIVGRASDRAGVRRPFLIGAAIVMALGLALMAFSDSLPLAIVAYALFGGACSVFLALHSVFAMQMLPSPDRRGRDLGLFNLTNTLPSLISPVLTVALVPGRGFATLMLTLAALAIVAAGLVAMVRHDIQAS